MKYAMVPICSKEDEDGTPLIRRVLIEFTDKIDKGSYVEFSGTRFVACDLYFLFNKNASHKYIFEDDGYRLESVTNEYKYIYPDNIYSKRKYHYIVSNDILKPPAMVFEIDTDDQAKEIFCNRGERIEFV